MTDAGWYAEPGDRKLQRYWDGTQWTPSTRLATPGPTGGTDSSGVGIVGLLVVLVGLATVVISYTAATWLDFTDVPGARYDMSRLAGDPDVHGFPGAYLGWLGWLLLVIAGAFAIAGCLPSPYRFTLRVTAGLFGLSAAIMTVFVSISMASSIGKSDVGGFLSDFTFGFYLAIVGYLVIGLNALVAGIGAAR